MPSARTSTKLEALYEIGHILGRGASGVAFIVRPKPTRDPPIEYVAKEIWIGRFDEKKKRDAFAECQLLRKLSHNHIVTCIDIILDKDVLYIVMEHANGGDLAHRIMARKKESVLFSERTVMSVFIQICVALHHIHWYKILHRDLKPANVFIFGEAELDRCVVKLGDFGIAKMLEGTHCQAHSTVGTPSYLSPEICKNNPYGRQSDIWALGVVLYELACLKVPFQAGNLPAMALMICTSEPQPMPDEFSEGLTDLVKGLLEKDPTKRPAVGKVLHTPYVQQFMGEDLLRLVTQEVAAAQSKHEVPPAQVRRASLPKRGKQSADKQSDHDGTARLPSCGPSVRPRMENKQHHEAQKFLLQEDARQWCWRRPNDAPGSDFDRINNSDSRGSGNTPRHEHSSGGRQHRSERTRGKDPRRTSPSTPVQTPPQQQQHHPNRHSNDVLETEIWSPTHPHHRGDRDRGHFDTGRRERERDYSQEDNASLADQMGGSRGSEVATGSMGMSVPPLPLRSEPLTGTLTAATRSASPMRGDSELPAVSMLKASGSTPALPPLPRLLAPARVPTRSRSSACLQQVDSKSSEKSDAPPLQRDLPRDRGSLFRTAPVATLVGESGNGSCSSASTAASSSTPPPIVAPPVQSGQAAPPPPPPPPAPAPPPSQRQAPRDESRPQAVEGVLSTARVATVAPRVQAIAAPVAQPARIPQGIGRDPCLREGPQRSLQPVRSRAPCS
mmetsp:Transcript_37427/g.87649  ORF Transcript_37427/g.87649 Transcript_37427/m.87649 type:complete len:727 (+) Transcript_37427:92-2272(+)